MTILEAVQVTDPRALERARRLQYAVTLLRQGRDSREVSGLVRKVYSIDRSTAWRIVNMAADLVIAPKQDRKP